MKWPAWLTWRWWTQPNEQRVYSGFWYVRALVNQPDGTQKQDTKINQLWTSREDLLVLYERRVGPLTQITPFIPSSDMPSEALYRWYDSEEEHAYRYFYIRQDVPRCSI